MLLILKSPFNKAAPIIILHNCSICGEIVIANVGTLSRVPSSSAVLNDDDVEDKDEDEIPFSNHFPLRLYILDYMVGAKVFGGL